MTDTFVGELCDQFLICRLCSTDYKRPKTLSCLHTFCEACLEMHYEMEEQDRPYRFLMYSRALACPICRSRTELPTGGIHRLPDNFLVANLGEVINRRKPQGKGTTCEICKVVRSKESQGRWDGWDDDFDDNEVASNNKRTAVTKCLDCVKMLCQTCAELHRQTKVTQLHTLYDLEVQKDIECKIHENEMLKFYCEECQICVCVLCTFNEHQDHDVATLAEGGEKHRGTFEKLMRDCSRRSLLLREQLETIDKFESEILKAESNITDTAIEAIAAIRRREKALMAELKDSVGERALNFISKKDNLQETLKDTEQASSMAEILLKGASIELLLVKKEMQEKLDAILSTRTETIPESLSREMDFSSDDYNERVKVYMNTGKYNTSKTNGETESHDVTVNHRESNTVEIQTDDNDSKESKSTEMQTDLPKLIDSSAGPDIEMTLENDETESVLGEVEADANSQQVNDDKGIDSMSPVQPMSEVDPMSPVELISPVEYVTPMSKDEELTARGVSSTETSSNNNDGSDNTSQATLRSNLAQNWQDSVKSRASIAASQDSMLTTPPSTPSGVVKSLKEAFGSEQDDTVDSSLDGSVGAPVTAKLIKTPQHTKPLICMVSIGTEMEQVKLKDSSTGTITVSYHDKETGTPYIHTTSKFVSTDTLGMVDKCTMTAADVTAAYRNVASSRRIVTVSRGTCTPKAMFPLDRATSPVIWSYDDDSTNDAEKSEAPQSKHLTVPQQQSNPTMRQLPTNTPIANGQQIRVPIQQVKNPPQQPPQVGQQMPRVALQPSHQLPPTQQLNNNQQQANQPQPTVNSAQPRLLQHAPQAQVPPVIPTQLTTGTTFAQKVQQQVQQSAPQQLQRNQQQLASVAQQQLASVAQQQGNNLQQTQKQQPAQPMQQRLPFQQGQQPTSQPLSVQQGQQRLGQQQAQQRQQPQQGQPRQQGQQPQQGQQQGQQRQQQGQQPQQGQQQGQQRQQQGQQPQQGQQQGQQRQPQGQQPQQGQQQQKQQQQGQHTPGQQQQIQGQQQAQQQPGQPQQGQQTVKQGQFQQSVPQPSPMQRALQQQPQLNQQPQRAPVQLQQQPHIQQQQLQRQQLQPQQLQTSQLHLQQAQQLKGQQPAAAPKQLPPQQLIQQSGQRLQGTNVNHSQTPQSLHNQSKPTTNTTGSNQSNQPSYNGPGLQGTTGAGFQTQDNKATPMLNQKPQVGLGQATIRSPLLQNQRLLTNADNGNASQLNHSEANQIVRNQAQNETPVAQGQVNNGSLSQGITSNVGQTSSGQTNLGQQVSNRVASQGLKVNIGQTKLGQANMATPISGQTSPSQTNTSQTNTAPTSPTSPTASGHNLRGHGPRQFQSFQQQHMLGLWPVQNVSEISNKFNQKQTNPGSPP